jgi:Tfp pilus assembly protein PilF
MAGRCFSSALQNQALDTALSDCNTALRRADKLSVNYPLLYVDRGLVRLRRGDLDKAALDFNAALKIMPKNARALYARAVAESHQNKKQASDADLQAAKEIAPEVAERFERYGIAP